MKKILVLSILALAVVLSSCGTTDSAAKAEPAKEEKAPYVFTPTEPGELDLSTANSIDRGLKFNEETGVLTAKGIESFSIPLGEALPWGTVVTCRVVGKNNGSVGFRGWLTDDNQRTAADPIYMGCVGDALPKGDFDVTYEVTANEHDAGAEPPTNFFLKGPQWGTLIDNIEIYKVVCTWGADSGSDLDADLDTDSDDDVDYDDSDEE